MADRQLLQQPPLRSALAIVAGPDPTRARRQPTGLIQINIREESFSSIGAQTDVFVTDVRWHSCDRIYKGL
jgi:hypothetical protein